MRLSIADMNILAKKEISRGVLMVKSDKSDKSEKVATFFQHVLQYSQGQCKEEALLAEGRPLLSMLNREFIGWYSKALTPTQQIKFEKSKSNLGSDFTDQQIALLRAVNGNEEVHSLVKAIIILTNLAAAKDKILDEAKNIRNIAIHTGDAYISSSGAVKEVPPPPRLKRP